MARSEAGCFRRHCIETLYRPSVLALVCYAIYVAWLLYRYGNDATVFIYIGSYFADRPGVVSQLVREIGFGPPYWRAGFDGQFYYYIALDPFKAWELLDTVARYQRILYPMLVRLLSFGVLPTIPYLMIAVNLAFMVAGTEFLCRFLRLFQLNPWYSIGYAFNIGLMVCLRRDLAEPIMCALVIAAIYLVETRGPTSLAGVLFSLALFTKETAILFILPYTFWFLLHSREDRARATIFALIAVLPYSLFQTFLFFRFGLVAFLGVGNLQTLTLIPFYGILQTKRQFLELVSMITLIAIPATASLLLFLKGALRRKSHHPLAMGLLLNALFLIFLPPPSYLDVFTYSRVALGLAIAWMSYAAVFHSRSLLAYSLVWAIPFQFMHVLWLL